MPKKTKKEKIISQYRRKLELLKKINLPPSNKLEKSNTNQSTINKEEPIIDKADNLPLITEKDNSFTKKYFLSDFKKSLLFSFLIITIEVTLSLLKVIK